MASLLGACSFMNDMQSGGSGPAAGAAPLGVVVADEPLAARSGGAVLREGGSAADAATAIYFALAVTYPVAGGLGGGGICLVRDPASGRNAEFDFLARAQKAGGSFGVPENAKGFAALQASFGRLAWNRDIVPAERLASLGFSMSDALAQRLAPAENLIRLDASLAGEFLDESGKLKPAGTTIVLPELSETLARIRTDGANGFARDVVAARIAAYTAAQGGAITVDELAQNSVVQRDPASLAVGRGTVLLPQAESGAATYAAAALLSTQAGTAAEKESMSKAVTAAGGASDDGATGFVARDSSGQAVSCAVTMNGALGAGRTVPATGVTLANAPTPRSLALLAPAIAIDRDGQASAIASASGSTEAEAALADAVSRASRAVSAAAAPSGSLNIIRCDSGACRPAAGAGGAGLGLIASP